MKTKKKFKVGYSLLLLLVGNNTFAQSLPDTSIYHMQPIHMKSRWASKVTAKNALKEYPRPQLERKNWQNLNGLWEYAITDSSSSFPKIFTGKILVPYPIESSLSGVQKKIMPNQILWYKRNITIPYLDSNHRKILNFEAVDWQTTVIVNKKEVTKHSNGYQRFSIDITDFLHIGNNELLLKVFDPSDQGPNPHGKQVLNPTDMYYTSSSGIWQTVWLETIPITNITSIKTTPDIDNNKLTMQITCANIKPGMGMKIIASANGKIVSQTQTSINNSSAEVNLNLAIPNVHLWSPDDPYLYDLEVKITKDNQTIDEVKSYFGMRKINIQKDEKGNDRIFLNNKYTFNLGVLDQGFWPEGLYTAPTDEALAFDIKVIKAMGFNAIRKHIKIEPERWYYHADKIGILVWQDFVNPPYNLSIGTKAIFEKEVKEAIDQLHNHPSIVIWVVFNERWGAYDQQRITEWVKKYDPSRIVNGHSGELLYVNDVLRQESKDPWVSSDITDVHSYPNPRSVPGQPGKAKVLGEFGGIGVAVPEHEWNDLQGWGYIQVTPSELKDKYRHMIQSLKQFEQDGLSGAIYTQPFDIEGEENGLLTYDRAIIKIPINEIQNLNKLIINPKGGISNDPELNMTININEPNIYSEYNKMLEQYKNGKCDSSFLRRLSLLALKKNDQLTATQAGNSYIKLLTQPLSKENLTFISRITNTTKDTGFQIFKNNCKKINVALEKVYAEYKVKGIIDKEELSYYSEGKAPKNWDSVQESIGRKYGELGEELVLGKRMMYYYTTQNWENFGRYYLLYFKKAMTHPDYITNNLSWSVFQQVTDLEVLKFALKIMEYDIKTWNQNEPQAYDTYANLLHKLNRSNEAIKWEEKAIQLKRTEAEEKVFAETLQKMKSGLPTWPQNN